MNSVTFSTSVGGDGSTVTDDNNATTGLRDGGWKTRFIPCFTQQVAIASHTVTTATNAATSATAAAASATAAAASYDSFDDRYLGAKASDPVLDNDGNALLTGALYWNTVSNIMKAWSGSAWSATYVPASGFLTTSDIGATVQAYDSNLTSFVGAFTLPTADGTNGQVVITNGSGSLSFGSPGVSTGKSIAMAMIFG